MLFAIDVPSAEPAYHVPDVAAGVLFGAFCGCMLSERFNILVGMHYFFKKLRPNISTEGRVSSTDGGLDNSGTTVFVKALPRGHLPTQRCKG